MKLNNGYWKTTEKEGMELLLQNMSDSLLEKLRDGAVQCWVEITSPKGRERLQGDLMRDELEEVILAKTLLSYGDPKEWTIEKTKQFCYELPYNYQKKHPYEGLCWSVNTMFNHLNSRVILNETAFKVPLAEVLWDHCSTEQIVEEIVRRGLCNNPEYAREAVQRGQDTIRNGLEYCMCSENEELINGVFSELLPRD